MRLKEVILRNFRGYAEETRIPIEKLTAFIGKNDVGESTILEALDTFFNQSKLDTKDKNTFHQEEETIIGCVFDEFPGEIILDESVSTSLAREYLLNERNDLEIWKKYSRTGKETIWIYANHPSNPGFDELLSLKNASLKSKVKSIGLDGQVNLTINSEMRTVLWESLGTDMILSPQLISADSADEKRLWPQILPFLPTYRLFKSDRASTDEDDEAQDPMQEAIKLALEDQAVQLATIAEEVQQKVSEVANRTIQKLQDFDPALAAALTPQFKKEPSWEKAFSFTLTDENEIPLNKRGSGIRRLVLFSFFRATTESNIAGHKNIIYAIEEPETSQHPDAQKIIIETFKNMVEQGQCQIILTTHVPGLAGLLPLNSLRYITNEEGHPEISCGNADEGILKRIADTLGVFPSLTSPLASYHDIKLIVCVEGPNDVEFLYAISRTAHKVYPDILDLRQAPSVAVIPLGGGTLQNWVNHNYLQKLKIPEYHIYDSDNSTAHDKQCDKVNKRGDGSSARTTKKREMENYIHSDVVYALFRVNVEIDDTMDVSTVISKKIWETNPEGFGADTVEKKLNKSGAEKMTLDMLRERDPDDEVLGWLKEISLKSGENP